jgi:hypothetical protein
MKLDEQQQKKVAGWVAEGLKLADIQKRISSEFGVSLTYMEARFLVDDLKLVPQGPDRPKEEPAAAAAAPGKPGAPAPASPLAGAPATPTSTPAQGTPGAAGGGVSVTVDTVTRAGALASGNVRFSDGQSAGWYLDQYGRLGLVPQQPGYKPGAADVEAFQHALEREISRLGL